MKTIIYGNGAMAKVLYAYAKRSMDVVGFTVDDVCIASGSDQFCGLPLAPFSAVEQSFAPDTHRIIIAVGFMDMNALRARKHDECARKGYRFDSYVHESVILHEDVSIGENCIILDHVSIHPGCRIGDGTFISSNVNLGHDCDIGRNNWINSGVAIAGGCYIGMNSFFGVNSSVGHKVTLGMRNFIAANTFIDRSSADDEVYLSEPAQRFRLKSTAFLKFSKLLGS